MNNKPQSLPDTFSDTPCDKRAVRWKLRTRTLSLQDRPLLMGIVNVTPDSFSDGGRFFQREKAVEQALRLVQQGADLIDIGGESTRPYSEAVDTNEELQRVLPVLKTLTRETDIPISIDTTKAEVARQALDLGVEIINDISAYQADPKMLPLACNSGAGLCAMHMKGTPQTMQDSPSYVDVVSEIFSDLQQRRDAMLAAGIQPSRICLDPGIGFGKTDMHNLLLLKNAARFHRLHCPLLFGASRKGFIGKVIGDKELDQMPGTIGVSLALARQGVQILRVHDVQEVRHALLLFEACGGLEKVWPASNAST